MSKTRTFKIALPSEVLGAWLLMLGLGNLHDLQPAIPAPGYVTCLLLAFGLGFIVSQEPLAYHERSRG